MVSQAKMQIRASLARVSGATVDLGHKAASVREDEGGSGSDRGSAAHSGARMARALR